MANTLPTLLQQLFQLAKANPEATFTAAIAAAYITSQDRVKNRIPFFPPLYWTGGVALGGAVFYRFIGFPFNTQIASFYVSLADAIIFIVVGAVLISQIDFGPDIM